MIYKRKDILSSNIAGRSLPIDYRNRGKLNRAWYKKGTITINDVVSLIYKLHKLNG